MKITAFSPLLKLAILILTLSVTTNVNCQTLTAGAALVGEGFIDIPADSSVKIFHGGGCQIWYVQGRLPNGQIMPYLPFDEDLTLGFVNNQIILRPVNTTYTHVFVRLMGFYPLPAISTLDRLIH